MGQKLAVIFIAVNTYLYVFFYAMDLMQAQIVRRLTVKLLVIKKREPYSSRLVWFPAVEAH